MSKAPMFVPVALLGLILLGGTGVGAEKDPALVRGPRDVRPRRPAAIDGWSYFKSRDHGAGIRLRVQAGDATQDRTPVADAMAIRYIAEGRFGPHPSVSIDGRDDNRAFVRFDVSDLPTDATLTLRLASLRGVKPLSQPLEVGVFQVLESWEEGDLRWAAQPRIGDKPVATFRLRPDDGWNEVALPQGAPPPHGWMLRAVNPKRVQAPSQVARGPTTTTRMDDPLARQPGDPRRGRTGAADGHVWMRQKEHGAGVLLDVTHDGTRTTLVPIADALLISYLPAGAFGRHRRVAIDGAAQNQTLLRFAPESLAGATSIVLRMAVLAGPKPLSAPLRVGIYPVRDPWTEDRVTWSTKPATDPKPLATFEVPPADGWVTVDLTQALQGVDTTHGWLLRAATPVAPTKVTPARTGGKAARWRADVLASLPWATSVAEALRRAKATTRPVLTVLRASHSAMAENALEDTFLATVVADPVLARVMREQYVPLRTFQRGWRYTTGHPRTPDPLAPLGVASHETKPLALIVSSPEGKVLRRLEGIGTFDREAMYAFLAPDATKPAPTADEQRYVQGVQAATASQRRDVFAALPKDGPWQPKVQAWQQWPARMRQFERHTAPEFADRVREGTTEAAGIDADEATKAALKQLVALQRPNGSWGTASGYATQDPAVSALAALALHVTPAAPTPALARARGHLRAVAAQADATTFNAWSGAYLVDLLVQSGGLSSGPSRAAAERAVQLLVEGQLDNGAWSYDLRFGKNWRGGFGGWPVTDLGRAHSMNTGPALVALLEAQRAGIPIDAEVLARGAKALLAMRDEPAVFTYTWPGKRNFNTLDQSIGRACACEHALLLLGKNKPEDVDRAIEAFLKHRGDLWRVAKVTAGWSPPRAVSSYFCLFAYYHAARAIHARGGPNQAARLALLRNDVLEHIEMDGTWLDYEGVGKAYGTAMGLLLLHLTRPV